MTQPSFRGLCWTPLVLVLGCLSTAHADEPTPEKSAPEASWPRKQAKAVPLGEATIALDGRLDEPVWQTAPEASGMVERVPVAGRKPPTDVTFRVLYAEDRLYVGARVALMPGEAPRTLELRRDNGRLFSDDALSLKFDVRQDYRTVLGFAVSPGNAQLDYIALDNGSSFRTEHDMVWDSAVHHGEGFWSVEYVIPYVSLGGVPEGDPPVMGFNVTRDHNARIATDDWNPMLPEFGAVSALHFGELVGVRGAPPGQQLVLIPYGVALSPADEDHPIPGHFRVGGDLQLRLNESTWVEATALTDFAQVDLDDTLINLDRFPLFFPERRPFFLSGLDVFNFGSSGSAQLFFSRRIGLDANGGEIPLYGGMKLYGRGGRVRYGALNAVTAEDGDTPAANWSVGRARVEVGDGHIGAMAVSRQWLTEAGEATGAEPHVGVGLDTRQRAFGTRLEVDGFSSMTTAEGADPGIASRAGVRWRGASFRPSISTLHISDEFDPQVGFVRRRGIWQNDATVSWVNWTQALNLQRWTLSTSGNLITDDEGDARLGASGNVWFDAVWQNGWGVEATADYVEDVVENDFTLAGRNVLAGTYTGPQVAVGFFSPSARNPGIDVDYRRAEGFFGGHRDTFAVTGRIYLSNLIAFQATANYSLIEIPEVLEDPTDPDLLIDTGDEVNFTTLGVNSQLTVTPGPNLSLDTVAQVDSTREQVIGQARLRWRYQPGSDLFVVWRERVSYCDDTEDCRNDGDDRRITLKLTWRADVLL